MTSKNASTSTQVAASMNGGGSTTTNNNHNHNHNHGGKSAKGVISSSSSTTTKNTSSSSSSSLASSSSSYHYYYSVIWSTSLLYLTYLAIQQAYTIRLRAIDEYGPVIHEFDPYFNYRATEYLYWNGYRRFFTWYDTTVWYPLGRPVGTTIYPGMQFIAVWLKDYVIQDRMSLNDICCYMPAWFGVLTTIITGLIAYECTLPVNADQHVFSYLFGRTSRNSNNSKRTSAATAHSTKATKQPFMECCIMTMLMMSIVPAHLMRSMGGGYDNESVAVTAMVLTFYCWIRSLRNTNTIPITIGISILTGLSYFYMVAAWGGYVFVLNLIGVHAAVLVGLGRFTNKVYIAYTLFYVIGTTLAVQIPVVGWAPLKSLEQLGPCAVFLAYQLLYFTEQMIQKKRTTSDAPITWMQAMTLRVQVFSVVGVVFIIMAMIVLPTGYFGPISSRVRGLFVQHTKTGNPLVDSVAEHQPASTRAYFDYLHHICSIAPIGYILVALLHMSDPSSFLLVWGASAYYFSLKMVRLVLLTAPIACVLGGIVAGRVVAWCITQWWDPTSVSTSNGSVVTEDDTMMNDEGIDDELEPPVTTTKNGGRAAAAAINQRNKSKKKSGGMKKSSSSDELFSSEGIDKLRSAFDIFADSKEGIISKRLVSVILMLAGFMAYNSFVTYSWRLSYDLSHPTIIQKARTREGQIIFLDDYRDAYWWIRDNTPKDSRIMAWWDYGYQISAIANRTTIADGNTWNHEHIALLGKALTTDMDIGWEISRHLADYVLIWGGGGGDDLAKSPHLARIANSVYRDHCPNDPTCRAFGVMDRQGTPSPMMRRSLLFGLHSGGIRPDVVVPTDKFQEVFRSKYGKVRIYKIMGVSEESKKWVEEHRRCDVKGSWFCPGQYPPGLQPFIDAKTDFRQLEDFNRGAGDAEYTKRYFEDLQNPGNARKKAIEQENKAKASGDTQKESLPAEAEIARLESLKMQLYNRWEDSIEATRMWNLINENKVKELDQWLKEEPHMAFLRSKDGRGPMFWAFESRNEGITELLMRTGLPHTDSDIKGLKPTDLLEGVK